MTFGFLMPARLLISNSANSTARLRTSTPPCETGRTLRRRIMASWRCCITDAVLQNRGLAKVRPLRQICGSRGRFEPMSRKLSRKLSRNMELNNCGSAKASTSRPVQNEAKFKLAEAEIIPADPLMQLGGRIPLMPQIARKRERQPVDIRLEKGRQRREP